MAVSDSFYREVIRHGPERDLYWQLRALVDRTWEIVWIWRPDDESSASGRSAYDSDVPIAIYVSDGLVHPEVESAVEGLLTSAGLEIERREQPERGRHSRRREVPERLSRRALNASCQTLNARNEAFAAWR